MNERDLKRLKVGSVVRYTRTRRLHVLVERKDDHEVWPGWWCLGGGGLADFVLIKPEYEYVGDLNEWGIEFIERLPRQR